MPKHILTLLGIYISFSVCAQQTYRADNLLPLDPSVKTGKLANGMTYYIKSNPKPEKRMEIRLAVNAGSVLEEEDQQGLAHFLEHMAFNGSAHFKGNELINFIEKSGVKFGPHLNAYTSFDETVYMLQMPTDREGLIDSAMLVFSDWASGIAFDTEEVEKERGVVIEEWRLRLGADERMRQQYWPAIFQGSAYANRLPIGTLEVLQSFNPQRVIDFYRTWYRPEYMAIIVVGDIEPASIEKKIRATFEDIQPYDKVPRLYSEVPDFDSLRIGIGSDAEAEYTMIELAFGHPPMATKTFADLRKSILLQLANGIINERLTDYSISENPIMSYGYTYYGNYVRTRDALFAAGYTEAAQIPAVLEALIKELRRVKEFGFNPSELERQKEVIQTELDQAMSESGKTSSAELIWGLIYHYLQGEPYTGEKFMLDFYNSIRASITLEEVNAAIREKIDFTRNNVIIVTGTAKENGQLISEGEVRKIYANALKAKVKPYVEQKIPNSLLATTPRPGKIHHEEKNTELDVTVWHLDNGARVVIKTTDFKNDEIMFRAVSKGGSSVLNDKEWLVTKAAGDITMYSGLGNMDYGQLEKYMAAKQVYGQAFISNYMENMIGSSSVKDLEILMQSIYACFAEARFTKKGLAAYKHEQTVFLKEKNDPKTVFHDSLGYYQYDFHPRSKPDDVKDLAHITLEETQRIWKNRFTSTGDFDFFFVGNVTPEMLRPLVEKYIAGFSQVTQRENYRDVGMSVRKEPLEWTLHKGKEPQARAEIKIRCEIDDANQASKDFKILGRLLSIRLREVLREEMGGVYGISGYPSVVRFPDQYGVLSISFGCDPNRLEELIKAAKDVYETLKTAGPSDDDLRKLQETTKRETETFMKENRWWMNTLVSHYFFDIPAELELKQTEEIQSLSASEISKIFNTYFDWDNAMIFRLLPESQKR